MIPRELAKMKRIVVRTCGAFALTVSEVKTETTCLRGPDQSFGTIKTEAAGQKYMQTREFTHHKRGGRP